MNKKKTFHAAAALSIMLCALCANTSCSQDETAGGDALPEGKYPLRIGSVSIAGSETRVSESDDGMSSQWSKDDLIRLKITYSNSVDYAIYSYDSDSKKFTADGEELYWQAETATIKAWYDEDYAANGYDLNDQSGKLPYILETIATEYSYQKPVDLTFRHRLAKVTCNISKGDNVTDEQISGATVNVYGGNKVTDRGLEESNIYDSGDSKGWITPMRNGNKTVALVAPSTLSSGTDFIKVSIGGNDFTYSLPEETTFEAGYAYTYDIEVMATGLNVACSGAWGEGNSVDVSSVDVSGVDLSCIDISQYEILSISSITDDTYTVADGKKVLIVGDGTTYDKKITVGDGATLAICNLSLATSNANLIKCAGDATIMLLGENEVSVTGEEANNSAVSVAEGKTMTIDGTGKLTATGGKYGAGIGSGKSGTCGDITINGGTITTTGGSGGAGIGSGQGNSTCGDITINGGTITATGGSGGAGIGTGRGNSTCGDITINGGTIKASSTEVGAGIGSGGENFSSEYSAGCGNISIMGGTVTAESMASWGGAGIGAGAEKGQCKNIFIGKGVTQVTAKTGNTSSAPIGLGRDSRYNPDGSYGVTIEEGANVTQN